MTKKLPKYLAAFALSAAVFQMVFGTGLPPEGPVRGSGAPDSSGRSAISISDLSGGGDDSPAMPSPLGQIRRRTQDTASAAPAARENVPQADTTVVETGSVQSAGQDTVRNRSFLDDIITGKSEDSLVYRPKDKLIYIYRNGDVTYGGMNMKADFMRVELDSKQLFARGTSDTLGNITHPVFTDSGTEYSMDSIVYNIESGKAKIKGVVTQQGDGYLIGNEVKKMPDNTININSGRYTTCNQTDHPHFYLQMTKAKLIPGKKIIVGPAYLVMEDVPTPLAIPEAFFPLTQERSSGIIVPSYGEESTRGFFLRDGGYYWAIGEHVDLQLLGSIYTYGSWDASISSRYVQRYKFSGQLSARYASTVNGMKGDANYSRSPSMQINWTHTQDPKFRPGSNFSARVQFQTSGYRQNASTTLNDYVNTSTTSSISYQKTWAGTPFSLAVSGDLTMNSRDSTVTFNLPNIVFNVSRFNPFKRKNAVGKQRWYEKISMSYTANIKNGVSQVKENEVFTPGILDKMRFGVKHSIPISTSFNLLNYINVSPSANYTEVWSFREVKRTYDPSYEGPNGSHERRDTTYGFHRLWNYNLSVNASTKIYGMYDFTKHEKFPLKMLRHTMAPTIGFTFAPDFGKPSYGYWYPYQTSEDGEVGYYSPFNDYNAFSGPGRSPSGSLTFSLVQTLEAKVASKSDTSGMKKVSIIDNLTISSSYNFLADSLNLAPFSIRLNMKIPGLKNVGLNISATLDPYDVEIGRNGSATRVNRFMAANGKGLGRITNVGTSFGYSFSSKRSESGRPAINDPLSGGGMDPYINPFYFDPDNPIDPVTRRQMMTSTYYDFNIPWNLSLTYTFNYTNNGSRRNIVQTLGYQASVNLTPKWGISFNGGFDLQTMKMTAGTFSLVRDLHCWQMSFSWVPFGQRKSWQFKINVLSPSLQDLKYDKQSSYLDNLDW